MGERDDFFNNVMSITISLGMAAGAIWMLCQPWCL